MTLRNIRLADSLKDAVVGGDTIAELAPGAVDDKSFTALYTLKQADIDAGKVDNAATVTATLPAGGDISSNGAVTTPIAAAPGLVLEKKSGPPSGNSAGSTIAYTFTVRNTGNVTLKNIRLADSLKDAVVGGDAIAELAPGAVDDKSFTALYTLKQADIDAGKVDNAATVTATLPAGGDISSNGAVTTPIAAAPGLVLEKKSGPPSGNVAGSTIAYTFTVRNTGNVTLRNIRLADSLKDAVVGGDAIAELAPGAVDDKSFTALYTLKQADIDAGKVDNAATVTATLPAGGDISSNGAVTTPIAAAPGLVLEKKSGPPSGNSAGSTIAYTFTVRNTGNVTLRNIRLADSLKDAVVGGDTIAELAPGAVDDKSFTALYTLKQADIDAGKVDNAATVTATLPAGGDISSNGAVTTPIAAAPGLVLEKKSGPPSGNVAGSTIAYTFTVRNTGNVTLKNIRLADSLKDAVVGGDAIAELAPGAVDDKSFTALYTLKQADIDAGKVDNAATVTATLPAGGDISSNGAVTTPIAAAPGLVLEKKSGPPSGNVAGSTIAYTFTVRNTGNVTLKNIRLADSLKDAVVGGEAIAELAPGAVDDKSFTALYTLKQADIDAGKVDNAATVTATLPAGGDISSNGAVTTPIAAAPGLVLEKKSGPPSGNVAGSTIAYSFTVKNTGNVTLTDVKLTDALSGAVVSGGPIASLAPGATDSTTFTALYTLKQADIDAGKVDNAATVTATLPAGGDISSNGAVTTPIAAAPGLVLEKKSGPPSGNAAGSTIAYTFTVRNTGNVTLRNIRLADSLKDAVVGGDAIAELAPGAVDDKSFTALYTLKQADIDAGKVDNTATASGTMPDGKVTSSNASTVTTTLSQGATLELIKTAAPPSGNAAGATIAYNFTVKNTGNVTLTEVKLTDALHGAVVSGAPIASLAPGATDSTTFTALYTLTQADIDAGKVENTATASGTMPDGKVTSSDASTVTTTLSQGAALELVKTASPPSGNAAGATITYFFTVRNTGNVTLNNIAISDDLPNVAVSGGPLASLAPGAEDTSTFTARYTLTQADIDAGGVANTATATATVAGSPTTATVTSTASEVRTPIEQSATIALVKTAKLNDTDGSGLYEAGESITYRFEVTNTGNVVVNDVIPTDHGPTFNKQPAANKLSAVVPGPTAIAPKQTQVFEATYTLAQSDIDAAAGIANGIVNKAKAEGTYTRPQAPESNAGRGFAYTNPGQGKITVVDSAEATAVLELPAAQASSVTITKQAGLRQIRRGEKAPFIIKVINKNTSNVAGLTVLDRLPAGFRYVGGSATLNGKAVEPRIDGSNLRFDNLTLGPKGDVVIRLQMLALSTAGPGKHVNKAQALGSSGKRLAPEASAAVEIMVEPVFDCGDLIGRVFDDLNSDGYPNDGERGLPGVRIATVRGLLVTTDEFGRFHVACADLPDARIGSNFIMKLDTRTLPAGYHLTTENPRVIRLTAGKMSKLNFGAAQGRVVRLDLKDEAFEPALTTLKPRWDRGLDALIEMLKQQEATLRISYPTRSEELAAKRMNAIEDAIAKRWKAAGGGYALNIETRVEVGQ
ncbi:CARDB domain-containing protein [Phyllobacterium sp. YR620]|uniref:DUF7507 domain-containing protein n=1 Tax=Phyllobacterium sp. YR620 TaxID=1881066 RepID=UPI001FCD3C40|nr:CARDB domain-containing protein [Phyllobacterium sp. YR620]